MVRARSGQRQAPEKDRAKYRDTPFAESLRQSSHQSNFLQTSSLPDFPFDEPLIHASRIHFCRTVSRISEQLRAARELPLVPVAEPASLVENLVIQEIQ